MYKLVIWETLLEWYNENDECIDYIYSLITK